MKEITITLNEETGEIQASTNGFTGEECVKEVERILGDKGEVKKTADYYQSRVISQNQTVKK